LGAGHVAAAMPWGMRSRSPSPDWDFITHYEATVTVHLPGSGGYNLFLLLLFVGLFVCLFVVVFFCLFVVSFFICRLDLKCTCQVGSGVGLLSSSQR
jgi:hypothetical protein